MSSKYTYHYNLLLVKQLSALNDCTYLLLLGKKNNIDVEHISSPGVIALALASPSFYSMPAVIL